MVVEHGIRRGGIARREQHGGAQAPPVLAAGLAQGIEGSPRTVPVVGQGGPEARLVLRRERVDLVGEALGVVDIAALQPCR